MGIVEVAAAALAVMACIAASSAVAGAVMGSRRKLGSVRGFFWGLVLPVAGLAMVALSGRLSNGRQESRKVPHDMTQSAARCAREKFAQDNPQPEEMRHGRSASPSVSRSTTSQNVRQRESTARRR